MHNSLSYESIFVQNDFGLLMYSSILRIQALLLVELFRFTVAL